MAQGQWSKALVILTFMSHLTQTHTVGVHRLCGFHLVEALLLVCEGRGFYFRPRTGLFLHTSHLEHTAPIRDKGPGIVEKCCYNVCTYYDLEHYCNR
ncbi:hypothetical protein GDO86_012330 [Hymenochirus boettgeri]|uniref:Insulin-like domain-containing protein n=1 Tax=Hymenochirus boettgeri TaxID=247094 RepID=A0A8T2ISH7_9PIPI|nr:hypothetical protein GDO86_012330 [Hymenochirus boettgeri]